MKLFQTTFNPRFIPTIRDWAQKTNLHGNSAIIHIYAPYTDKSIYYKLDRIQKILNIELPGVPIVGCSAIGEIINGSIDYNECVITLTVFDDTSTQVKVLSFYDLNKDFSQVFFDIIKEIPDLKGLEIVCANSDVMFDKASHTADSLPDNIEVFGAIAVGDDDNKPFIFTDDNDYHTEGVFLVLYSGKELHIQTNRMFGWKAIGYPLHVTRAEGNVVYELDGKPAYDVYSHYLNIKKGPNFFYDALEFPWEVQVNEETVYIRHAKSVNPDGSIVMSTNVPVGSNIRLTYGDPLRIMEHTKQAGQLIRDFAPQAITIYNCFGRKLFWGEQDNIEIVEISKHMDAAGFSALGEIMRFKGKTILNNLSIVTASMREGEKQELDHIEEVSNMASSSMPITARLAVFINTITEELMEKNNQLNDMLYKASHDALTDLLNRGAIERLIYETDNSKDWFLIMFDIDNFKNINDTYGHIEGDNALKNIANYIKEKIICNEGIECGRWGGEEFIMIISDRSSEYVKTNAEEMIKKVNNLLGIDYELTISAGATMHQKNETVLQTITRVDELLYKAKNNGKNQLCSDL
ncbi:diguanylate cyclase (GGDEF) domain-containing protein [Butyrivibrio proteoclasticus]|uniref:Diguanylate cyclase (GGDEF) domain-containing protein n=1 Tax=Butyrivibrio proteoclasticus TaxID=43305 RepID=A0A1I5U439_9FIRM|nr:diguanylate cyclase [Butyrivibrio proteoclasticus]SFP90052.1 diguanylate cyclase (GGDEF) domain-containing protein [Butyrivibrio proteoclasticus]